MAVTMDSLLEDEMPFFHVVSKKEMQQLWGPALKQINRKKRLRRTLRELPFFTVRSHNLRKLVMKTPPCCNCLDEDEPPQSVVFVSPFQGKSLQTSPSLFDKKQSSEPPLKKEAAVQVDLSIVKRNDWPIVVASGNRKLHFSRTCWKWNEEPGQLSCIPQNEMQLPIKIKIMPAMRSLPKLIVQKELSEVAKAEVLVKKVSLTEDDLASSALSIRAKKVQSVALPWYNKCSINSMFQDVIKALHHSSAPHLTAAVTKPESSRSKSTIPAPYMSVRRRDIKEFHRLRNRMSKTGQHRVGMTKLRPQTVVISEVKETLATVGLEKKSDVKDETVTVEKEKFHATTSKPVPVQTTAPAQKVPPVLKTVPAQVNAYAPQLPVSVKTTALTKTTDPAQRTVCTQTTACAQTTACTQTTVPDQKTSLTQATAPLKTNALAKTAVPSQATARIKITAHDQTTVLAQATAPIKTAAPAITTVPFKATALPQTTAPDKSTALAQTTSSVKTTAPAETTVPFTTALPQTTAPDKTTVPTQTTTHVKTTAPAETTVPFTTSPVQAIPPIKSASLVPATAPAQTSVTQTAHRFGGDGVTCKYCNKVAYFQERIKSSAGVYHEACFRCSRCKNQLKRSSYNTKCSELYCDVCFKSTGGWTAI